MTAATNPAYWLAFWFLAAFGLVAALAWIDRRQQRKQADAEWRALLAAVGMTSADMRRRWDERGAA